jgi:hypothetical protein
MTLPQTKTSVPVCPSRPRFLFGFFLVRLFRVHYAIDAYDLDALELPQLVE